MSCGKQMPMKYIYRISHAIFFLLGSSNLFLPAISKIWPAFGHWQPAISSPERMVLRKKYQPIKIKPVDNRPVFYLPHHTVIREDRQKTKIRIGFPVLARSSSQLAASDA